MSRHAVTIVFATLVIVGGDLLGASIDLRTYLVMGTWIGVNVVISRWANSPIEYDQRVHRYGWSIAVDVIFLAAAYVFLDAARYLGVVFFAHQALVASSTLPRRWALAIATLIIAVYGALATLAVYGPQLVVSPIGLSPVTGNRLFIVASVASVVGMVGLLLHLQVRMIKSIRDAEMRYQTLVQSAYDMVMTFDEGGHFIDANPATLEQSGYRWEELKLLPNSSFFPQADWPAIVGAFERTKRGESVHLEVRYIRKDGSERWVLTSAAATMFDGRHATVVIARDVTDAHQRHDELRERDSRLALVLDALNAGFMSFDRDLRVTSAFGEWARERAARGETLVGRPLHDLIASNEIIAQHENAERRVLTGETVSVQWKAEADDGVRLMRSHIVPVRDANGEVTGGAGLWVDETDLAIAEAERERLLHRVADADRVESLGKLVSGVAHELNNPLAAILNFTEDLLADARAPEERIALEVIQAQALRSRTIVRDLLTYARRDVARARTPVNPGPILHSIARAMRPGFSTQGVDFTMEIADAGPALMLDRTGFEQVVTNLLTNAAHAAGSGGNIRLTSRVKRGALEVIVEDNGAGISPEAAGRIFEPFFTTKPTGHGVGLGLSVSLGIVHAHGGTLTAENRPADAGGGARFVLRIPIQPVDGSEASGVGTVSGADRGEHGLRRTADAPRRSAADPRPISESPSGPKAMPERRPTILIIDDEGAIRQGLRRYFTRKEWVVEESADGADALAKLLRPEAKRIYDVVLCDLKMAGVSGMDVYDRMLAAAPDIAARFILSTGDTSAPDVSGFLATVSVPILEKPFELTVLETLAHRVRSGSAVGTTTAGRGPS